MMMECIELKIDVTEAAALDLPQFALTEFVGRVLAEDLGSKVAAPGIGFSIGEDRLVMSIEETRPGTAQQKIDVYVVPLGAPAVRHCAALAYELRKKNAVVEVAADGKLKRALEIANKLEARHVLIVGENEMNAGAYALKHMESGEQVTVTREQLLAKF